MMYKYIYYINFIGRKISFFIILFKSTNWTYAQNDIVDYEHNINKASL